MATKLEKALRREVIVEGNPYTVTIAPEGLKLVPKRAPLGLDLLVHLGGDAQELFAREVG